MRLTRWKAGAGILILSGVKSVDGVIICIWCHTGELVVFIVRVIS